jgi:hypothetical protein
VSRNFIDPNSCINDTHLQLFHFIFFCLRAKLSRQVIKPQVNKITNEIQLLEIQAGTTNF